MVTSLVAGTFEFPAVAVPVAADDEFGGLAGGDMDDILGGRTGGIESGCSDDDDVTLFLMTSEDTKPHFYGRERPKMGFRMKFWRHF